MNSVVKVDRHDDVTAAGMGEPLGVRDLLHDSVLVELTSSASRRIFAVRYNGDDYTRGVGARQFAWWATFTTFFCVSTLAVAVGWWMTLGSATGVVSWLIIPAVLLALAMGCVAAQRLARTAWWFIKPSEERNRP
ncbi:hypothetical protein CL655_02370 [bacterium]|nr:hypothetical protein [bacterium]